MSHKILWILMYSMCETCWKVNPTLEKSLFFFSFMLCVHLAGRLPWDSGRRLCLSSNALGVCWYDVYLCASSAVRLLAILYDWPSSAHGTRTKRTFITVRKSFYHSWMLCVQNAYTIHTVPDENDVNVCGFMVVRASLSLSLTCTRFCFHFPL